MSSRPSTAPKSKGRAKKPASKAANGKTKEIKAPNSAATKSIPVAEERERSASEKDEDDSEEEDDIDEVGMNRLMELLGEGELDDIAKAQLGMLNGDEDEDEEEKSSEDEEDSDDGEESEGDGKVDEETHKEPMDLVQEGLEEVDLEDAESVDEDAIVRQKIVTNNETAMERIRKTFQLDPSLPWTETLAVTYDQSIEVDVNDDLQRELAFYKQALHCATRARDLSAKHKLPFTRPSDFYAEMVKSDAHMERIRQRLLDETAGIKRSEQKKKEREGKKFGKKVQIEKLKEREKGKKELEERIKGIKRKRKDALEDGDDFDVQIEDALTDKPSKRHAKTGKDGKPALSRKARDAKYGFGGKVGRRAKQNTRDSTDSFARGKGGHFGKAGKGKKTPMKRLGKSRRMKASGK